MITSPNPCDPNTLMVMIEDCALGGCCDYICKFDVVTNLNSRIVIQIWYIEQYMSNGYSSLLSDSAAGWQLPQLNSSEESVWHNGKQPCLFLHQCSRSNFQLYYPPEICQVKATNHFRPFSEKWDSFAMENGPNNQEKIQLNCPQKSGQKKQKVTNGGQNWINFLPILGPLSHPRKWKIGYCSAPKAWLEWIYSVLGEEGAPRLGKSCRLQKVQPRIWIFSSEDYEKFLLLIS